MGDRHGGCFARRGRALNPPRPQVDAHRGVGFRWRATVFRCRGVVGRICPRAGTLSSAKASRHSARAKGFAPRRNTPHGEGLPTRRTSERICPAQEHAPRRKPPDTAHEQKNLPRAGTLSSTKASRHGARAKEFAPREKVLLGEGLPTRREGERIGPHENALLGESIPTRRTSEKICPTRGSRSPHGPTNGGPPSTDGQPKNTPSAGSHPRGRGRCRVHSPKKNKTTP